LRSCPHTTKNCRIAVTDSSLVGPALGSH